MKTIDILAEIFTFYSYYVVKHDSCLLALCLNEHGPRGKRSSGVTRSTVFLFCFCSSVTCLRGNEIMSWKGQREGSEGLGFEANHSL